MTLGTSKWNKIEHRLFCHITQNWRGQPLIDHETIVNLIGSTRTATGLRVTAKLDQGSYPLGIKVSDEEMEKLEIIREAFHGEWNYTISPGTSKWNKIEHRRFCHITQNWRGQPLIDRETIVNLLGSTRTATQPRLIDWVQGAVCAPTSGKPSGWPAAEIPTPQRRAHEGLNKVLSDEFADRVRCPLDKWRSQCPVGKARPWLRVKGYVSSGPEVAHV